MGTAMLIVTILTATLVCVAGGVLFFLTKLIADLVRYHAIEVEMKPQGYFITYMIVKDHDARNEYLRIPPTERIRSGREVRYGSEMVCFPDKVEPVFAPTQMKIKILQKLQDDEISRIDLMCVVPLTRNEIAYEDKYTETLRSQEVQA